MWNRQFTEVGLLLSSAELIHDVTSVWTNFEGSNMPIDVELERVSILMISFLPFGARSGILIAALAVPVSAEGLPSTVSSSIKFHAIL